MKLSADNILAKTVHGFDIYAYVLRQYYRQDLLRLGNSSVPAKNPFTGGSPTLVVELRNAVATHRDLETKNFRGDVFDFANLYFKCATKEELYFMINQVMNLGLKICPEEQLAWLEDDDSWRPRVSFFLPPISNILPHRSLSLAELRDLIAGPHYRTITRELRALKDPQEQRNFKATRFAYVTFSGCFTRRKLNDLQEHSGLLAIDLDHLPYLEEARRLLLEDRTFDTEMLFVSPSGTGLKWILRFDPREMEQKDFFLEVADHLERRYRLQADVAAKDIPRASFLPFDPDVFLHPRHEPIQN